MANEENLVSLADRTKEERQEIGRKGGLARAENIKKRKSLKEGLIAILEKNDNNNKISIALSNKALNGERQAFTTTRDTLGDKPREEVKNVISYEDTLKKVSDPDEY